jgi:hypothetical protein
VAELGRDAVKVWRRDEKVLSSRCFVGSWTLDWGTTRDSDRGPSYGGGELDRLASHLALVRPSSPSAEQRTAGP